MTALPLATAPQPVRDEVKLMVARTGQPLEHTRFIYLADALEPGDLLVVNASATIPAALSAQCEDGTPCDLHLSTPEPGHEDRWVVELRKDGRRFKARQGERLTLPAGGRAQLLAPYLSPGRLWIASLDLPAELLLYLAAYGDPIQYAHSQPRPLADHQTIFATEPGSAEMPSAGRPFSRRVLASLRERGIGVQRIVLHTGVSSQERGERPYPERFRVSAHTARRVNAARRVIAVGTTVVRALESAADDRGEVHAAQGWTSLVITPERGVRAVDGLLTGWHEPEASHLLMLEAIAGRDLLDRSYAAANARGYRWHEFGDVHLIAP